MKILLVAKLSDEMLSNLILKPLLGVSIVEHIYVLRDTIGHEFPNKVTYLISNSSSVKKKSRHFSKLGAGIRYCNSLNIDIIIGVLIYPHGYIGQLISLFTNKPYIHVTIAGQREFWLFGKIIEFLNILLFKRSYIISVTGTKTLNYLISKGFSSNKVKILPNIIDMDNYLTHERKRDFDIISLSRLDGNKNVSLLLRAVSRIKDQYKLKVLIVGVGPEQENLQKESEQLGLTDIIHFVGWVAEEKKVDAYNSGKIYVLCSKGEGFPLSLLEAMACGCVPIVSNVGDITDVVKNGQNGFVFNDFISEYELKNILIGLLSNSKRMELIRAEAIKVRTTFGHNNSAILWSDILNNIHNQCNA